MKMLPRLCVLVGAFAMAFAAARGEVWHTSRGPVNGRLAAVFGPLVVIAQDGGSAIVSVDMLEDAELGRVADFITQQAAKPKAWKDSRSRVATALRDKLVVWRDGKLVPFEFGDRPEPDFYLVYFGALWCGPCRRFSPGFVKTYERLQQLAPGRFEVIFDSHDESAGGQIDYVKEVQMPWPIVRFNRVGSVRPLEQWAGPGIPCVVAVTREGDLLFHSYHGEEYVGPERVLTDFEAFLRNGLGGSGRLATHRLATIQHVRAAPATGAPAKPYLISIDLRKYQTLEASLLTATLDIDEKGAVTDAVFEPKQPSVIDYQLVDDASHWLFLPAVRDGHPIATKVKLPLQLK